jgi:glycosyltransferase involved in cell wall biosynthesis
VKIAIIAPGIWNTVHWDFARALVALGHRVAVYTEDKSGRSGSRFERRTLDGIDCFVLSDSRRNPWTWVPDRLFKALLGRRFFTTLAAVRCFLEITRDVDVRLCEGDWMGVFVALAARAQPFRWVVSVHDTLYLRAPIRYPGRPSSGWRERLKLWVLRRATGVRANSAVTCEALVQGGCAPGKIFVVPLPIAHWMQLPVGEPLPAFRQSARREVRERHGIPERSPLFISMCRLDPAKGLDLAIEALGRCANREARLMICGGDRVVPGLGSHRERLEDVSRRAGLADRVLFAGHVALDEVKRYLAAADLHLAPSVIDTFNYAVVEATLAGTLSLMSDKVGAAPWIVQAGGGEVLAGRDAAAWAARMDAMASRSLDEPARRSMSEQIAQSLAPASVAREMLQALERQAASA